MVDRYPPIAEHGMVGDLQTAALVSSAGTIDWWCTPRFDSPSVFASLLDSERGGHCRFAVDLPEGEGLTVRQLYLSDTAVLITRYMAPGGVGEVADFMAPVDSPTPTDRHRIIRIARVVRGSLPFTFSCRPRFDYARAPHTLTLPPDDDRSAVFHGPGTDLHLQCTPGVAFHADGDDVTGRFTLSAGQAVAVVLTGTASGGAPGPAPQLGGLVDDMGSCRTFWLSWLRSCSYRGRWQDTVNRSAITLKLLTYAPTGAPIAAATMGLPEQIGGERNWDYRYTWVRDASLSVRALIDLGFEAEAYAYRRWLRERVDAGGTATGTPCRSCTGSTATLISPRRPSTIWRATRAHGPSGPATRPPASSSSTSTARRPTRWRCAATSGRSAAGTPCVTYWTGSPTTGTSRTRGSGRPAAAGRTSPTAG